MTAKTVLCLVPLMAMKCMADILWTDALDTANSNGVFTWTEVSNPTGTVNYAPTTTSCPNGQYCWELEENYFIYYIHSTLNYENITLTLSVSGASLETGANPDSCSVYYSLDSTINFELPALASFDADYTQFPVTSYIVTLPSAADDNSGIGIKLAVESNGNGNKFDYCYFSDVTLRGDLILTSPPTAPTTANPTTANPTTAMPSVSPTTADPSSSPTTANPTATYNPTTDPSSSPTTTMSPTASTSNTDDQGENEEANSNSSGSFVADNGLYIGIGAGVLLVICVAIILCACCRKNREQKQSTHAQENIEQDVVAKQYLDAYTGGGHTPHGDQQQQQVVQVSYDDAYNTNEAPPSQQRQQQQQLVHSDHEVTSNAYDQNTAAMETNQPRPEMPAPPIELAQIFGRTDNRNSDGKDSDEDSLMKKQRMYSDDDSD